jgi:hypothetical protein
MKNFENTKIQDPLPLQKEEKLSILGACCTTSLTQQKFLNALPMHQSMGTYPTYPDNCYPVDINDHVFPNTIIL